MYRHLVTTIISVFFSLSVFAQQPVQTIRGTVIDNASNSPLSYANIAILKTSKGAVSDSLGNFTLQNVSVGRYDILVSMLGYEPLILKEIQVTSVKEVFLNISLKENATSLTEVIIKPRVNKEQPINSTATVSAKMLSVEEAKRYAGGFDDPARLVSAFAGVSSNVSNNAIIVRGNSPQALQWKLEGVEIPNPNHFADLSAFGGGGLTALSSQLLANSDFFRVQCQPNMVMPFPVYLIFLCVKVIMKKRNILFNWGFWVSMWLQKDHLKKKANHLIFLIIATQH